MKMSVEVIAPRARAPGGRTLALASGAIAEYWHAMRFEKIWIEQRRAARLPAAWTDRAGQAPERRVWSRRGVRRASATGAPSALPLRMP